MPVFLSLLGPHLMLNSCNPHQISQRPGNETKECKVFGRNDILERLPLQDRAFYVQSIPRTKLRNNYLMRLKPNSFLALQLIVERMQRTVGAAIVRCRQSSPKSLQCGWLIKTKLTGCCSHAVPRTSASRTPSQGSGSCGGYNETYRNSWFFDYYRR